MLVTPLNIQKVFMSLIFISNKYFLYRFLTSATITITVSFPLVFTIVDDFPKYLLHATGIENCYTFAGVSTGTWGNFAKAAYTVITTSNL